MNYITLAMALEKHEYIIQVSGYNGPVNSDQY